jgi:hypothetical protein
MADQKKSQPTPKKVSHQPKKVPLFSQLIFLKSFRAFTLHHKKYRFQFEVIGPFW